LDDSTPTVIINTLKDLQTGQTTFVCIDSKKNLLQQLNTILFERGITSLLVEGGAQLLQTFINENVWDEMRILTNPNLNIEKGIAAPHHIPVALSNQFEMGQDVVSIYHNHKN